MHTIKSFSMNDDSVTNIRARQALYGLLARLFLAPPDPHLIAELSELPGFAEHLSQPPTPNSQPLEIEYERLFGRSVYPYESLYVDRELMLNTAATERVSALYATAGYAPDPRAAGAADHLGLELGCMAHLIGRGEADLAARLLGEHLAAWAPVCMRAAQRAAPHPLYQAAAELTIELILSDLASPSPPAPLPRGERGVSPPAPGQGEGERGGEGGQEGETDDEEVGLNRVVRRLATPAEVGIFLSRADIAALGKALQLPAPIGERFTMLRGLFEAAGQFEAVPALLAALAELLADEQAALRALAGRHPAWEAYAQPWQARLAAGHALLAEMRAQADDL